MASRKVFSENYKLSMKGYFAAALYFSLSLLAAAAFWHQPCNHLRSKIKNDKNRALMRVRFMM